MSGITYDITERQRAEQRMANLQRLSEALTGAITRQDVYIVIQQQTAAAFSADAIFLRFPSPEGDALVAETLHVGGRQNEAAIRTFDRLPATLPHPANEAFLSGQPVFLPDVAALSARYPQLAELVHNSGAQAAMHLPLVRDGQAFGVISLAFSAARSFREADHTFAIAFADRCAVALERAMLHESLAASEKQLRLVTDGLPALIAYVDRERRYQFVNKTYSEWFGLQREAVIGRPVWELLGQAAYQAAKADIDQALAGQEVSYERRMPYNRGGARFVQTSLIPDRALDGTVKGFFALIIDLSERKRAEEALHAAMQREQSLRARAEEASRLKDEFLATVSHELRTPLTAFLGYAQMLQTRKRDEAYVNRTVEKMIRSARAQAQLIEDLLDMARIVSGRLRIDPAPVDLGAVLLAALDTVRPALEAKQLRLQSDLGPDPAIVVGDANRLQQVAWNLLANAVKFTPPGGLISVHLEADRREARLAVGDTGQGISPEFLPYVFDRFRQADGASNRTTSGLGIGLALVRHLVELHGGSVEAHSAGLGQGATFSVRLPLAPDGLLALHESEPRLALDDQESCPPELDGLRVLIVDDQPELLELLHEIMASCGCEVRACNNAQAALATLRAWQPEVLISDLAMPGQDGYWLISQVRALPPEQGGAVPALALTAYVRVEDRLRVLAAGFEQYVPKPIEPAELRDVVAQLARRVEA
jgi:PAS domain S-box-containing protein